MTSYNRFPLACLVGTLSINALAQDQTAETPPEQNKPTAMIEEVFVTASKRTESVQEVSAAVSAFSDELLKANNIDGFEQLADITPGLVSRNDREGNDISIRGIGKAFGGTSPVAYHINGFFVDSTEPFYDIQTIEVIRGPSGTVYGRNATAGAIDVKWQRPVDHWEVGGDLLAASYDNRRVRSFINVPVADGINTRFAGLWEEQTGYLDNELADGDEEPESFTRYFYRGMIEGYVNENLRLALHAIKNNKRTKAHMVASPSISTRQSERYREFGVAPMPLDLLKVRSQQYQDFGPVDDKSSRVVTDLTWSLEDLWLLGNIDVDLIGGVERRRLHRYNDLDGTEVQIVETDNYINGVGRNAELRFTSQNTSGIDWIFGLFWYRDDNHQDRFVVARTKQNLGQLFFAPINLPGGAGSRIFDAYVVTKDLNQNTKNEAAFLNVRANLRDMVSTLPEIELFAGIRYNRDEFRLLVERDTASAQDAQTGQPNPPFVVSDQSFDAPGESTARTGEIGGKWFYSDEGMIYGKYATGYKPGTAQILTSGELNQVDPEFLNMIEFGWKTALFDNRSLTLNVSAFDYSYEDLQVSKIVVTGIELNNAGAASIQGVEAELQWAPLPNLLAHFSFGWLDAKFEEFCGRDDELENQQTQPGCDSDQPHNFKGARMSDAPEFTFGALLRYTHPLERFGMLTGVVKFAWSDDYQRRPYDNPIDTVDAHHKTDIRLNWNSPTDTYRVGIFVENLEDHDDIFTHHFSQPDPGNYSLIAPQPPRTAGLIIEANW
ncbi:iron complex outermembrane receptor protein [Litorivivens lipolytica]|uniref:Iron complex outermembrane receptor protein n=1 Tax=Litorivivens lipolytica TaxID=1524264 RepID=A0A7W4W5S2_9GAMM|nr:TonB-dependent receptor [Litorivivens lipolytica]MBB3047608.1 iron complex outermembrane receptor protein [Litorivivens lipolytica]